MDDLEIIIDSLGDQNEEIEDDELVNIEEEIDSINEDEYFDLAKIAISLGKPQILEYLVKIFNFNQKEIISLYEEIKNFKRNQSNQNNDSEDEEDINEIMKEYSIIMKNCCKLPYKKNDRKIKK
jgi:hypothetical protein